MADAFTFNNGFNAAPCGYKKLTVSSTAVGFASNDFARTGVNALFLIVETAQIRWRDDGTNPTATDGMLMSPGDPPFPYSGNPGLIKFIRVGGTDGTLHASGYSIGEAGK